MTKLPYLLSENSLTVFVNMQPYSMDKTHSNFDEVVELIKQPVHDADEIEQLVNIPMSIAGKTFGKVTVGDDGNIYYKNVVIHNALTKRLMKMMKQKIDISHLALFMDNLMQNESQSSIDELYLFLEACDLPVTEDGHFLAYKRVRPNYTDYHSGTFDNSVGSVLEMPRENCDPDRHKTCSTGFHFCSHSYLPTFGRGQNGDHVMIVKINPKDVVSIPSDYNNAKGRTCKLVVVGELGQVHQTPEDLEENSVVADYDDVLNDIFEDHVELEPVTITFEHKASNQTFTSDQIMDAVDSAQAITQAAKDLGVPRSTLQDWIKKIKESNED